MRTANDEGGAIYNGSSLTITKSALNNNTARKGGAIRNGEHGELTITKSTINNNTAQMYGGAIRNKGSLTITESTLQENTAENGGSICNGDFRRDELSLIITKSSLTITESILANSKR